MSPLSRRAALSSILATSTAFVTSCAKPSAASAPTVTTLRAAPSGSLLGAHTPLPLPFAAGSLQGISDRMTTSHHQNNYVGAVKNLNRVEQELAKIDAETPPFVVAALRERELGFKNSKTLHEAYFGNLGGDGRRGGPIDKALARAYGTSSRWEEHFRATGSGLGGGSGWVVLAMELDGGALRTVGMGNHTQALVGSVPLLVMDMYEHAYQMDFGAAVARYLDAFFVNVKWDEVNRRLERAERAAAALAG